MIEKTAAAGAVDHSTAKPPGSKKKTKAGNSVNDSKKNAPSPSQNAAAMSTEPHKSNSNKPVKRTVKSTIRPVSADANTSQKLAVKKIATPPNVPTASQKLVGKKIAAKPNVPTALQKLARKKIAPPPNIPTASQKLAGTQKPSEKDRSRLKNAPEAKLSAPEQQPRRSNSATESSTKRSMEEKKRKHGDEEAPVRKKKKKIAKKPEPASDWDHLLDECEYLSTIPAATVSKKPLTLKELIAIAKQDVEDNKAFYANEEILEEKLEFRCVHEYLFAVSNVRTKHPGSIASDLPVWDHTDDNARRMLHAMQSVNIWLIDFCYAAQTKLGNSFKYTEMLSVYVGTFILRMRYSTLSILTFFSFCTISIPS
jgi:hypothetical protein